MLHRPQAAMTLLVAMVALIATTAHPTYADVCTYSGSGAWTVVSNWSPHQPTATDSVVVAASAILSVSSSTTVASMTLSPNSVFSITGGTFAVGAFTSSPTSKLVLTAGTFSYSSVVLQGEFSWQSTALSGSVAAAPFTASGKVTIQLGGGIGVASTAVTIASADVTWVSTSNYYPSLTSSSTLTFATGSVVAVSAQSANTNGLVFGDTTSRVYNYGQITITSSVCQALVSFKAQVFNYGSIIYADSSNCALPYRVDYASGLSNYGLIKVDDGVQWAVWTLQSSFLNAPNATLAPGLKVTSITSSGQSFRLFGTFAPGTTAISNLVISAASAQLYPSRLGVVALIANLGGNNALTLGPCTGDPAIVPATDSQEAFALAYACYATLTSISVRSGIFPLFKYFTTAFTPSISVSSTGNLQLQDATVNMLSTFFASSGTISCASAITPPCNLNFQASTNLTLLGTFTTNSAVLTFASTTTLNLPGSMYIYTSTASSKVVLASSTTLTKNSNQSPFSGIGSVANSGNLQVVLADPAAGFRPAIAFSNTGSVTVSVAPGITASSTLDIVFSDSFSNSGGFYFADSSNAGIPLRSIQFQSGYSSTATSIISANVSSVSMNFAAAAWVNGTFFGTALHAPTGLVATSVVPLLTVTGGAAAAQFGPASMNVAELVVSGGNIVLASCDGDPLFPCMTSIRRIGVTGTSGSCQLTVANTAMAIALQPDVWTLGGACQLTFPGSYQVDGGMFITGGRVGCVSGGDCSALDVMSNSSMQLVNSFTVYGSTLKFRAPLFIDFSGTNYVYLIGLVASSQLHFYSNTSISVARTVTTRAVFSSSATQLINYGTMTVQFVGCPSGLYMSAPFVNNGIVRLLGTGASAPCATNQLYLPDYSFSNFGTLFYDASTNNGLTLGMTFYSLATDSSSVMAGRVGTLTISSSTPSAIRGAFFGTTTSDVSGPLPYISSLQQLQLQAPVSLAPTTMNAVAVTVSSSVTQLNPCGADPSDFSCYASIATVGLTGTGSGCMLNVSSTLAAASLQPANWLLGGSCTLNIPGNYTMAGSLFLNGGFLKCTSANASCIVDVLSNSTVGDTTTFQVVQSILRFRNTVQWMASSTNSYAYLLGSSSGGFTASLEFYGATTVVVSRLVNSRLVYSAYSASLLNAGDMTVLLQTCPSGLNVQVPFVNTGSIRVMSAVAGGCTSHSLVLDGYQFTNDDDGLLFLDDSTNANNPFDLTFAGGVINTAGSAMFGRVGLLTISGLSSSIEGHFFGSSLSTPLTTLPYTSWVGTLTSSIAISFAPTSMQVVKLVVSASATTLRDCGGVAGASSCYASIQQVILYGSTTCSLTVASNATSTGLQPAFWSIGGSCTLNLPGSFPISGSVLLTGGTIACTFGGTCVVDIQSNSTIRLSDSSLTVTETSLRFRANVRWEIVSNSYIYLLGTRSLSELQFYSTTTVLNSRTTASRVVFSSYTAQIVNYGSLVVQLLSCPSFTYLSAPLINYGTILMQSVNLTCATHTLTQDGPVSHYGEFFFNTSSNGNLPVTINLNAGLTTWPGSVMAGDVGTMQLQGTAPYSIQGAFFGTIKSNLTGSTPYASSIASIATSASTLTWQPTTMNLAAITQTSGVAQFLPCDGVGSYVCYRSIATIAASGSASQLYVNSNMTALGDFQPSLQLTSGARLLISGSLTLTKPFLFRGATLTRMTGASMSSSILLMANGTVDLTATLVTDVPVTFADRVSILASTTNAFMYTTAQPARYIFASSSKTTVLQSIANPSTYYWYASDFTVPSYLVYGELNITYTVCGANFRAASNVLNAGRLLIQSTASGCSTPYAINFGDGVLTNLGSITVDTATVPSFSAVSVASLQSSDNSTLFANANITTLTISSSSYIGGVVGPSFKVGTLDVRATTVVNSSQLAVTSISTSSTLTLSACGRLFSYACYSSWRSLLASGFGSAVSLVQELLDVAQPSITVQAGVVTLLGTNITLLRPVTLTGGALVGSTNVSAQTVVTLYAPNNVLQASATVSLQSLVVRVAGGLAWTWTTSLVQLLGASNLASLVVLETGSILINSSVTESSAVAFGNSIGASNLRPWVNFGSMTFLAAVCNAKFITSATLINSGLIQFQTASATPCVDSIVLDFRMTLNNFGQIVTDKTLIPRFAPSSGMNSMILYPGSSFTGSFSDLQLTSFSDTNMIGGTLPSIDRLTSSGTLIVTSNTCPVARFVVRSTAKLILGPCSTAYFNTSSVNFTLAAETAFACYSGVTDVSVLEQSTVQLHQNLSVYLQPTWTFGSSSQATLALWGVVNMTRPVQFNGLVVTLLSGAPESATLNLLAPVTITRTMLIYDTHVAFAQPVNISMPASTQVMVAQGNLFLTGTLVHFLPSCTVQFNATLPLGSPQLFYTYVNAQILNEGTININMISCPSFFAIGSLVNSGVLSVTGNASCLQRHSVNFDSYVINTGAIRLDEVSFPVSSLLLHGYSSTNAASFRTNALTTINYAVIVQTAYPTTDSLISGVFTVGPQSTVTFSSDTVVDDVSHVQISQLIISSSFGNNSLGSCFPADSTDCWEISALTIQQSTVAYATANVLARLTNGLLLLTDATLALFEPVVTVNTNITWAGGSIKGLGGMASTLNANGPFTKLDNANMQLRDVTLVINSASATWFVRDVYALSVSTSSASLRGGVVLGSGASLAFVPGASVTVGATTVFQVLSNTAAYATVDFQNAGAIDTSALSGALALRFGVPIVNNGTLSLPGSLFVPICLNECFCNSITAATPRAACPFSVRLGCRACSSFCLSSEYLLDGSCVSSCPAPMVVDNSTCASSCSTPGALIDPITRHCYVGTCDAGEFFNAGTCTPCGAGCATCSSAASCDTCQPSDVLYAGACLDGCPLGLVEYNGACLTQCPSGLFSYNASCVSCGALGLPIYLPTSSCVETCPAQWVNNGTYCEACSAGCLVCDSATTCTQCSAPKLLYEGICYNDCPDGTYANSGSCLPCSANCALCKVSDVCDSCLPSYSRLEGGCVLECPLPYVTNGTDCVVPRCADGTYRLGTNCVIACPSGMYGDAATATCEFCISSCEVCSNGMVCDVCNPGFLHQLDGSCKDACLVYQFHFEGACYETCPAGTFLINDTICVSSCPPPTFAEGTNCILSGCAPGTYYFESDCLASCPPGTYPYDATFTCQPCSAGCAECFVGTECSDCNPGFLLESNGTCTDACTVYSYQFEGLCYESCPPDTFLIDTTTCVSSCPAGTYGNVADNTCEPCHTSCSTCDSSAFDGCTSCPPNHVLTVDHTCIAGCPPTQFASDHGCVDACDVGEFQVQTANGGICADSCNPEGVTPISCTPVCGSHQRPAGQFCLECSATCQTCAQIGCTSCYSSMWLSDSDCVHTCPAGQVAVNDTRVCAAKCPADTVLWSGVCYRSCPSGLFTHGNQCVVACPQGTLALANGTCILPAQCPSDYFISGTFCLSHCLSGYIFGQQCVSQCPTLHNDTHCLTLCPELSEGMTCVSECSGQNPFVSSNKTCVGQCPGFHNATHCLTSCPELSDGMTCVTKCSGQNPFVSSSKTCVGQCPGFHNATHCLTSCPELSEGMTCVSQCSGQNPFVSSSKTCVGQCPGFHNATHCLTSCPELSDGMTCVSQCSGQNPFVSLSATCVSECSGFHNATHCLTSCPELSDGMTCVSECSAQNPFVSSSKTCVSECSGFHNTTHCLTSCPELSDGMTCVTKCSAQNPFVSSSKTCVGQCAAFHNATHCLTSCPELSEGSTCVTQCSAEKPYVSNRMCLGQCPPPLVASGSSCVPRCEENALNGITWPATISNTTISTSCLGGVSGTVTRTCSVTGTWNAPIAACTSVSDTLSELNKNMNATTAVVVLTQVLNVVNQTSNFASGDLTAVTTIFDAFFGLPVTPGSTSVVSVIQIFVAMSSIPSITTAITNVSTFNPGSIIREISTVLLLASPPQYTRPDGTVDYQSPEIQIIVAPVSVANINESSVIAITSQGSTGGAGHYVVDVALPGSVLLALAAATSLSNFVIEASIMTSDAFFPSSQMVPGEVFIGSQILSFSVQGQVLTNLSEPLRFTFGHPAATATASAPARSCVWYDYAISSWSTTGCTTREIDSFTTECSCNHATDFSVLFDLNGASGSSEVLSTITYVGCALSLAGVLLTFGTFLAFSQLRTPAIRMVMHLCVAIFAVNLVFLAGASPPSSLQDDEDHSSTEWGQCRATAIFLHYFLLTAFFWMFAMVVSLFRAIVLLDSNTHLYFKHIAIACWSVPALFVIITMAVDIDNYGSTTACWITERAALLGAFVVPVLVLIAVNFVLFIAIVRALLRNAAELKSLQQENRPQARAIAAIFVLLGVTWVFGILALDDAATAMEYLFVIFNSLQGFFIFVLYCCNRRVLTEYRKAVDKSYHSLRMRSTSRTSGGHSSASSNFGSTSSGYATNNSSTLARSRPTSSAYYSSHDDVRQGYSSSATSSPSPTRSRSTGLTLRAPVDFNASNTTTGFASQLHLPAINFATTLPPRPLTVEHRSVHIEMEQLPGDETRV